MIVVLGIDLGKNLCSLVGLDAAGAVILRRRMRREGVVAFVAGLPPCLVAMEASCGAHHLGRQLAAQGREVRLMPPEYVRPPRGQARATEEDTMAVRRVPQDHPDIQSAIDASAPGDRIELGLGPFPPAPS